MTVTLTISTDNAAFENQAGNEVARILHVVATKLHAWEGANEFTIGLHDINGNKVGKVEARHE